MDSDLVFFTFVNPKEDEIAFVWDLMFIVPLYPEILNTIYNKWKS